MWAFNAVNVLGVKIIKHDIAAEGYGTDDAVHKQFLKIIQLESGG